MTANEPYARTGTTSVTYEHARESVRARLEPEESPAVSLLADFLPPHGPLYAQRREAAHSN